jgi:hypothetical protein
LKGGAARARFNKARLRRLVKGADKPRLRKSWRPISMSGLARAMIGVVGFIVALTGMGVLGFSYLLARGPIDLDAFKPRLLAALQDRLGDKYRVSLGSTFLVKPSNGVGLGFGFSGIEIDDAQGHVLLSAPGGNLSLDVLALLDLQVRVRRLEIDRLVLSMRIRTDGQWEIGAGHPDGGPSVVEPSPAVAAKGGAFEPEAAILAVIAAMQGEEQPLDHVAIANGRLEVVNQALGKSTIFEDFAISYDRRGSSAGLAASARGPAGAWRASVTASFGAERRLIVDAKDLSIDDLTLFSSQRPGAFTDMPLSLRLDAALDGAGGLAELQAGFGFGAGYVKLDDPDFEPILVDEATGDLAWDPAARRFDIHKIEALLGASHFRFAGAAAAPAAEGEPWSLHLQSSDSLLAPERVGRAEVAFDDISADIRVFPDAGRFLVDKLRMHGPKLDGELTAEFAPAPQGDGPELKMNILARRSNLQAALRIWPPFINPDARNWCNDHLHGGELASASMRLDWGPSDLKAAHEKRPVGADSVRGDFTFVGAGTDVLDGLPQLTSLDATGYITGRVFDIRAPHGVMTFPSGRKLEATDVYFHVPDTAPAPIIAAEGGAHVTGGADAAAEMLSQEAIRKFAGLAVDPANVKGQAQGQLTLALGLGRTAKPADQKFRVVGMLTALQLDKYAGNARFEQGALDFEADSSALKATGQGLLSGVPTKVELVKGANDDGAINLLLTIDDAMRTKLGLSFGTPMTGVMTVKMKAPLGQGLVEAEADLSKVDIANFDGSALKPAGKPGKATFTLKSAPDGVAVGAIAVDAGPIVARGTAQFSVDGALQNVKLSQLKFTASDDLKLDVAGGSPIKATLRGGSVDARALIRTFLSQDVSATAIKDLDVDAKVGAAQGFNGASLEGGAFSMSRRAGATRMLGVAGKLGSGAFEARKDEGGPLAVRAADAGTMSRFLDLYQRLEGGVLDLTLKDAPDGGHGQATLRRFAVRGETALKRIQAATHGREGFRSAETIDEPGGEPDVTHFDRMVVTFVRNPGRIEISDLSVSSASQGATLQGVVDFARDKLDIGGVYVPAYGVNSLMNKIPVFGALLAGGEHEGVFGVNFRVTGALSAPTLTVNPLSGVTPGIFRRIFGVFDGTNPTQLSPKAPDD